MKDEEVKNIVSPIIELLLMVAEKQSLTFELLAAGIKEEDKSSLLELARENRQSVQKIAQGLEVWR